MSWKNTQQSSLADALVIEHKSLSELDDVQNIINWNEICQVSPRYSLLSKTTLRNISGFLINKSGFKLYQYSKAS